MLALQGSFPLHLAALARLGVAARRVRREEDLEGLSGLILPGGESTVMACLLDRYGMFEPLRRLARSGLPMFGTCAGAILLGRGEGIPPRLEASGVELERNAYGAQVDSFTAEVRLEPFEETFHAVFIRAPRMRSPLPSSARCLGTHEGAPILVEDDALLLSTFHPELTEDSRLHRRFVERCAAREMA